MPLSLVTPLEGSSMKESSGRVRNSQLLFPLASPIVKDLPPISLLEVTVGRAGLIRLNSTHIPWVVLQGVRIEGINPGELNIIDERNIATRRTRGGTNLAAATAVAAVTLTATLAAVKTAAPTRLKQAIENGGSGKKQKKLTSRRGRRWLG